MPNKKKEKPTAKPGMFSDMDFMNDESIERILGALMKKEDIALKTEIYQPLNLARLSMFGEMMRSLKYTTSHKTIEALVKYYLEYMVSNNREGRKEIISAIAESLKKEQSTIEKLSKPPA